MTDFWDKKNRDDQSPHDNKIKQGDNAPGGTQIAINYGALGLNEEAVKKCLEELRSGLTEEIRGNGQEVTQKVEEQISAIVNGLFVKLVCDIKDGQADSEENLKAVIQNNFKDLQSKLENDRSTFFADMIELKRLLADKESFAKELQDFSARMQYEAERNYNGLCALLVSVKEDVKAIKKSVEEIKDSVDVLKKGSNSDYNCELHAAWGCLQKGKWDNAINLFGKATNDKSTRAEAYFGLAHCQCQVQVIWDELKKREQPICFDFDKDFSEDENYNLAMKYGTPEEKERFKSRKEDIAYIQKKFKEFRESKPEYDCFICAKVSSENGRKTKDYQIANEIYNLLKDEHYNPFFSERETKGLTGNDYEALIHYAISTSKCMLIVCTNEAYLKTPWVKNEWSRFSYLVDLERKRDDSMTFVFDRKAVVDHLPKRQGLIQSILSDSSRDLEIIKFVRRYCGEREPKKCKKCGELLAWNEIFCHHCGARTDSQEDGEAERKAEEARRAREEEERRKPWLAPGYPTLANYNKTEFKIKDKTLTKYHGTAKKVKIPLGVTAIGDGAFKGCKRLTSIVIPESVTSIGGRAFHGCIGLTSIVIPDSVTSIGRYAFNGCSNLTGELKIPDSVTSIGDAAFWGCSGLTSIVIPDGVTSIGGRAFHGCSGLTSIVIPNSVTTIGDCAFSGCSGLTSVQWNAENCTKAGSSSGDRWYTIFYGCTKLSTVTFGDNVKVIPAHAFHGCIGLTSVTIPDGVTSIGGYAFAGCSGLTIYCEATQKPAGWNEDWNPGNRPVKWGYSG